MTALATQHQDIAPRLLASRELLNLDRARTFIAGRLRAQDVLGATEYLELKTRYRPGTYEERLEIALSVCDLYRLMFPRQYEASQSAPYSLAREQEFYVLVNRHLFPLGDAVEVMRRDPSFFLPCIPLQSMQQHDWRQGAFDFWKVETVYQLAQLLSHRTFTLTSCTGWREFSIKLGLDCPAPAPPLCAVGWQLFSYACAIEETPLRYFPIAFEVTNYSTRNHYLDVPPGATFGIPWKGENVAQLLLQRRQAAEILARVILCDEWLDDAPRERIARAVELWNRAAQVEAQSGYAGELADDGEYLYVPEMPVLTALMEAL